jgi:hypothetical protein
MGETERIRARSSQAVGVAMVAAALFALGLAVIGGRHDVLTYGAPVVLFGVLGWAAFWQPYVEVSDGSVTLANTLRTVEVPWPAVDEVEGRYGLRLTTAYGRMTSWAAQAPSGRDRVHGRPSRAAGAVSERLEALREAGHLDNRQLERPAPRTTWHLPLLAVCGVLVLATVVLPFLA